MIIPKVEKPIKIRFGKGKAILYFSDGTTQDLHEPNKHGCLWAEGTGHFGIHLIRDMTDGMAPETIYFTQTEIATIEYKPEKKTITLLEREKYPLGWVFDENGKLLQRATYYKTWGPTREFIYEHAQEIIQSTGADVESASPDKTIDKLIDIANGMNNRQIDIGKATKPPKTTSDGGKQ